MKTYSTIVLTIALIMISTLVIAQTNGSIQGTIHDATTGDPVAFASVQLLGTSLGSISDESGSYSIQNVSPGTYQLKCSFVGYSASEVTVQISAGQSTTSDLQLAMTSIMGEEVTITAMARGQAKAINMQISSINIKNIVSDQKIRELPDANAAEALARLPGVSVIRDGGEAVEIKVRGVSSNTIFVNGMRLDGGLGSISSSMIGSIELTKAFLPDQDADVLGGNVEFKMREALPGFRKDIWVSTGYNGFTKSFKMQDVSALLSNRFFDDRLGVMLSLSYDRKNRGRDVVSAGYQALGSSAVGVGSDDIKPVEITGVGLTRSENLNNRYGATLYTDFRLKGGKLYYQAFFSQLNSDNVSSSNNYSTTSASVGFAARKYEGLDRSFLHGLGGEHTLLGAKIDWGVSISKSENETRNGYAYNAIELEAMSNAIYIDSTSTIDDVLDFATHDLSLTEAYSTGKLSDDGYVDELAARLNIEVPFRLGSKIDGYLKFGGKYRDIGRGYKRRNLSSGYWPALGDQIGPDAIERLPDFGWTYTPTGAIGHEVFVAEPNVIDFGMLESENAKIFYSPDFDKAGYVADVVEDKLNRIMSDYKDDYTNTEQYYAGYIMSGINIGQIITFTPGIRYEKQVYSTTAKWMALAGSYGPFEQQGTMMDTTAGHFNEQFFPMFHLKIQPTDWFDIRLAATKTATRPGFGTMSPRYYRDLSYNLSVGNVYLKPQINYNYDIYLSFYTGKTGLFTVGAFYKKMTGQVLGYTVRVIDPEEYGLTPGFANKNYTFPVNNEWPGYVQGIEFDWQTHFSFLPRPFNGIILNMNFTFMQSETRYPFYSFETIAIPDPPYRQSIGKHDSRTNTLIGMPDRIGNVALGYELGGFAGRISAYYQSATITQAQATEQTLDVSKDDVLRLDMQLSQKFRKLPGLILYLNINNLTNNTDRSVLTHYSDRIIHEELYGTSGSIGARYKF